MDHIAHDDKASEMVIRQTAELGLAALISGVTLFVAALIGLMFNVVFWYTGPVGVPMKLAYVGGVAGVVLVLGLSAASLYTGVRGIRLASTSGQPRGLTTWGTLMSAGALVLWIIVSIDLVMILNAFSS